MTQLANHTSDNPPQWQRLDTWLWAARWFKTRGLAKEAIEGGKIKLNDHPAKASARVKPQDNLQITRAGESWHIRVLALNEQRRPASEAEQLYTEDAASQERRAHERELRRLNGGAQNPNHRPDSHARELLRRLRGKQ
jgi:ribosome-associated heat shock protein Hsp15